MMILLLSMMMIQCKKKNTISPAPCPDVKTLEGRYVGSNVWQHDTIIITFKGMNSNCKSLYTIKNFASAYNQSVSQCTYIPVADYEIVDNIITATHSTISPTVPTVIAITIWACSNNAINYNKLN